MTNRRAFIITCIGYVVLFWGPALGGVEPWWFWPAAIHSIIAAAFVLAWALHHLIENGDRT